jgi:hypothetical protein
VIENHVCEIAKRASLDEPRLLALARSLYYLLAGGACFSLLHSCGGCDRGEHGEGVVGHDAGR